MLTELFREFTLQECLHKDLKALEVNLLKQNKNKSASCWIQVWVNCRGFSVSCFQYFAKCCTFLYLAMSELFWVLASFSFFYLLHYVRPSYRCLFMQLWWQLFLFCRVLLAVSICKLCSDRYNSEPIFLTSFCSRTWLLPDCGKHFKGLIFSCNRLHCL